MIRIKGIRINIQKNLEIELKNQTKRLLNINPNDIINIEIVKKSIDARKEEIFYMCDIDVTVLNEKEIFLKIKNANINISPIEKYESIITGTKKLDKRPIIVGSGPAGLFCAYMLAKEGYKPLIIERGECVEKRIETVNKFFEENKLNPNSNIQFGEGGAGTFSDGKLNTMTKDKSFRQKEIFKIFVEYGANKEILYENKPHIGTDVLREVIKNMRKDIIELGGEFLFETLVTDLMIENDKIVGIKSNELEIKSDVVVLAIGHSARDTFKMLYDKNIKIESKPFAVGIRIQHEQKMINKNQYKKYHSLLPAADYKLTYNTSDNRGVYSFCMCPGGYVVNASSEKEMLVINGMSNNKRDTKNANSAIVVTVTKQDFKDHPLAGIEYQRELERKAYNLGNSLIPVQLYKDYKNNSISTGFDKIKPVFKGKYNFANINDIFPENINKAIIEAIEYFGTKIKGFNDDDAIIAAVESRTSSPVRILRNESLESNIKGLYPCGEGAGYAGGITSSAVDGIKVFEKIIEEYKN